MLIALTDNINALAKVDPQLLQLGATAVALTAALGPLLLIMGRLAALGGVIAKAAGLGLASTGGAGVLKGGALPTAAAVLTAIKKDAETDNSLRSSLRSFFGIADPNEPAPWQPGGSWNRAQDIPAGGLPPLSIDGIRSALGLGEVKAELQGAVDINSTVKVVPTDDFWLKVDQRIDSKTRHLRARNDGPGSEGEMLPEAASVPLGGP
jgi:hypothetical protein